MRGHISTKLIKITHEQVHVDTNDIYKVMGLKVKVIARPDKLTSNDRSKHFGVVTSRLTFFSTIWQRYSLGDAVHNVLTMLLLLLL